MAKRRKKKKLNTKFLKRMQKKLWLVYGAFCILFVGLIGRLMYIHYTSGEKYEKIVLAQQNYDSTILAFQRGNIVDAKGSVLATSVDVYNVILDCKVLNSNPDNIDTTTRAVAMCFPNISEASIREKLFSNPSGQYVILAKKVPYESMAAFLELKESESYKGKINGIWFEKDYIRQYPYKTLAAATLGFASSGNTGVIGLENQYNSVLNGVNGRTYGYQNADNNLEQTTIEPINGNSIQLSLDVFIQSVVEEEMLAFNKQYEGGGLLGTKHTACIVMNPKTGEIYAMAQYPTFDLSDPYNLEGWLSEEDNEVMTDEDKLNFLNSNLWQNFAVTYTYEPGSTFKPFTLSCGLETGTMTGNESYYCDGHEEISGHDIHCVNRNGHGMETVNDALSNSCNDAFMQMSYVIGSKNFAKYESLFGIGQKTGIDLPGEASTATLIYNEEGLSSKVNLATNSFGQNLNVTMVQLATGFSSVINGGYLYKPHLVTKITDRNGNTVSEIEPTLLKKTVSPEVSEEMREYLYNVVDSGTARNFSKVEGYSVGGKTGTAEKLPRGNRKYLVSFIGFAPASDPQVVCYVIVDEPNTYDQAHSSFAQGIFQKIMTRILPYLNVPTVEEEGTLFNNDIAIEITNADTADN